MISVLIPVYNFDVRPLVAELLPQFEAAAVPFEIVVADDGSTDISLRDSNSKLGEYANVVFLGLETNYGRSKIRNFLSDSAKYDILLYLDCDARMKSGDYVSKYLSFIRDNCLLDNTFAVLGGLSYRDEKPPLSQRLRYRYGVCREVRSASERQADPYRSFTPFNLLISKSVFRECRFDESMTRYGYEDAFFGAELKRVGVPVYHIDNPMYHDGIVDNDKFLDMVDSSCFNLVKLVAEGRAGDDFVAGSKLLKTFFRLRSSVPGRILLSAVSKSGGIYRWLAKNCNSLVALDLYKLAIVANGF